MIDLLAQNPLLVLFLVAAVGFLVGRVRVGGFSLGSAAVLFAGLAIGALDPRLKLPDLVYQLGLILFVYTVAVSSGPGFRRSFSRRGLRDNLLALGVLLVGGAVAVAMHFLFHLKPAVTAGLFTGALTNTPALAAVLDTLKEELPRARGSVLDAPVFAYSVAYPFGVVGLMLAIYLCQRWWKIDYQADAARVKNVDTVAGHLLSVTVRITRPDLVGRKLVELREQQAWRVLFGRVKRGVETMVFRPEMTAALGDLLTVVGDDREVEAVAKFLGERVTHAIDADHSVLDYRRIFVSNRSIVGRPLGQLRLPQKFGGIVTRVRRGDIDFLPHRDTVLELGDRVRVLAPRERMDEITKFFGDSYKTLSEIDVISFGIGISLGLLLGLVTVPLPGGNEFRLGLAGGPLVVGLFLGMKGRSGPIIWQLPYSANLTLRQIGLVLFFAGIGTKSGYAFVSTLREGSGLMLLLPGAIITFTVSMSMLIVGYKVLKIPMSLLTGMVAGVHTQAAGLTFANEQSKLELPNLGYATVYPIATVTKILLAPLLLTLLS